MPFLILLVAGAYAGLTSKLGIKDPIQENTVLAAVIVLIISISFCSLGEQFFFRPDALSLWIYGRENPFVESALMADKIKEYTKTDDKIFIGGSEPQLYYFSQRKSISKFNITYPLAIKTPWTEDYQRQVINAINQNQPAAIIMVLRPTTGLWYNNSPRDFLDYVLAELQNNYRLIGGAALDDKNRPIWVKPSEIEKADTSLLLYLKK